MDLYPAASPDLSLPSTANIVGVDLTEAPGLKDTTGITTSHLLAAASHSWSKFELRELLAPGSSAHAAEDDSKENVSGHDEWYVACTAIDNTVWSHVI